MISEWAIVIAALARGQPSVDVSGKGTTHTTQKAQFCLCVTLLVFVGGLLINTLAPHYIYSMASALRRQVDALRVSISGTTSGYLQRHKGRASLLLTPGKPMF
eukprot:2751-Heterococcus_DN1.PRE.2